MTHISFQVSGNAGSVLAIIVPDHSLDQEEDIDTEEGLKILPAYMKLVPSEIELTLYGMELVPWESSLS